MYQVRRSGHARALLLVLTLCVFGSSALMAQEPCATECDTATAPYVQRTVPVQAGAGCTILLTIRQRICAGIHEVDILSATYGPGCETGMDPRAALEAAVRAFVVGNGMEFRTGPGGSQNPPGSWVWRVSRPACWMVVTATKQLVPCTPYCCISYLQVTRNENCPDWKISGETQRNATRACPRVDGTSGGGDGGTVQPCASSCDALAPWLR